MGDWNGVMVKALEMGYTMRGSRRLLDLATMKWRGITATDYVIPAGAHYVKCIETAAGYRWEACRTDDDIMILCHEFVKIEDHHYIFKRGNLFMYVNEEELRGIL